MDKPIRPKTLQLEFAEDSPLMAKTQKAIVDAHVFGTGMLYLTEDDEREVAAAVVRAYAAL